MIEQLSQSHAVTYHTVTLGALTREGDALAEITVPGDNEQPITHALPVPAGLPGEVVTVAVEWPAPPRPGKRKRYRHKLHPPRVWIIEIHQPSPLRVQALCPVFGQCGGCQLQHMRYEAQLAWKRSIVARLLHEIGQFDDPPLREAIPCADPWHYRNHMRFSVNREGQPGLTLRGTHRVLPLISCPIAHEQINRTLDVMSRLPNKRPQLLIRCGAATGQVMLQPAPSEEALAQLTDVGLAIHSETMEERLGGQTFRIRPSSFFQTNTAQAETMACMALNGLLADTRQPLTVVDAYCGVGTFALLLAQHVERVIAIEESPSAVKDAQWNLRDTHNVDILKGKVEDLLPSLPENVDGLVIDPPRAGCQRSVLDALARHPVPRIIYVSCDPATLARDLHILCHEYAAYRLVSVQPLDMFPHTAHIECVTVLEHVA